MQVFYLKWLPFFELVAAEDLLLFGIAWPNVDLQSESGLEAELLVDVTCQERLHYPFVIIELEIRHEAKRTLSEWDDWRHRPCIILLGSPE